MLTMITLALIWASLWAAGVAVPRTALEIQIAIEGWVEGASIASPLTWARHRHSATDADTAHLVDPRDGGAAGPTLKGMEMELERSDWLTSYLAAHGASLELGRRPLFPIPAPTAGVAGNYDIILDHFSRIFPLYTTPHVSC